MNLTTPRLAAAGAATLVAALALGGVVGVWSVGDPAASTTDTVAASESFDPESGNLLLRAAPPPVALPGTRATHDAKRDGGHVVRTGSADISAPARSGSGRRVVFDLSEQRVWLVKENGTVQRTYLVSGSKHPNLQSGRYRVYSKSRDAVSYTLDETMEMMVRFAHGKNAAIGFHDIPVDSAGDKVQTPGQLGMPLSAGCVRQTSADARAMWRFADVGTKVVVIP